jgi:hypothetical protein
MGTLLHSLLGHALYLFKGPAAEIDRASLEISWRVPKGLEKAQANYLS